MKHVTQYAVALRMIQKESSLDSDELLTRFKAVLEKRGHEELYPKIAEALLVLHEVEAETNLSIDVASKEDLEKFQNEINTILARHGLDTNDSQTRIDNSLIGGYKVTLKDAQVDASYKRSLISLYQTLAA